MVFLPGWVAAWLVAAAVVVVAVCAGVVVCVRGRGAVRRLQQQVREQAEQIRRHTQHEEAARAAVVALARKTQHSAHRIQTAATEMTDRHPEDSDVLETSNHVQHEAAQQARQAQTVSVVFGESPGRQWPAAVPLEDVIRAAAGRITEYHRVEVTGECGLAATPRVVEALIHVVAELLANATAYSAPTTRVPVSVRGVQRGAIVEIDDGGIGAEDQQLGDLIEIASGRRPVDIASLGEVPQLGLRAVGVLARRYGMRMELRPSVYGGLKAVLLVPDSLIENVAPTRTVIPTPPALSVTSTPAGRTEPAARTSELLPTQLPPVSSAAGDLPQRRNLRGEDPPPAAPQWPPAASQDSPEEAGAFMAAFFQDRYR